MAIQFTKMHGLGNDYVFVDVFNQVVPDPAWLAPLISDRHRGVGSDGLILLAPPEEADAHVRMIMFNADGSRAEMCGNGVRCLAKLAYERGVAQFNPLKVQTDRGVLSLDLTIEGDRVVETCVDMGTPVLTPRDIPVRAEGDRVVGRPVPLEGDTLTLTCVSMGNPHAVFFEADLERIPLAAWGPVLERHPLFPNRVNVHFAQVVRRDLVKMISWERGSGLTQACGTGAAAVCVAGVLNQLTDREITTELPGGRLRLNWDAESEHVFLRGPAEEVFTGLWPQS